MRRYSLRSSTALIGALIIAGCAPTINQDNLIRNRFELNGTAMRSWDEQMLLNLVRMRYRDNPMFLELGNVVAYQSMRFVGSVGGGITLAPQYVGDASIGASGEVVLAPTLTYSPLQGEEFAKRLLTPIPPATIFLLSQSGWSFERLMLCCVQRINNVENAVAASGPTPEYVPEYEPFQRLSRALRALQLERHLEIDMGPDGRSLVFSLPGTGGPHADSIAGAFKELLGLDPARDRFLVTEGGSATSGDEIALTGRSLLSTMFFLSQSVEVPERHEQQGKVTVTRQADGRRFDWSAVTGKVMRIQTSNTEPRDAAVKVEYRDAWFYIADNDLNSKTTFTLLSFLFNLQAANKSGANPVLTYPVR